MDGNEITTWRTAAASVVATKYLNNGTNILGILGAGTQARSHAVALDHFFKFSQVSTIKVKMIVIQQFTLHALTFKWQN